MYFFLLSSRFIYSNMQKKNQLGINPSIHSEVEVERLWVWCQLVLCSKIISQKKIYIFEEFSQRGKMKPGLYMGSFHCQTILEAALSTGEAWGSHLPVTLYFPLPDPEEPEAHDWQQQNMVYRWEEGWERNCRLPFSPESPQLVWLWKRWYNGKSKNSGHPTYSLVISKAMWWA